MKILNKFVLTTTVAILGILMVVSTMPSIENVFAQGGGLHYCNRGDPNCQQHGGGGGGSGVGGGGEGGGGHGNMICSGNECAIWGGGSGGGSGVGGGGSGGSTSTSPTCTIAPFQCESSRGGSGGGSGVGPGGTPPGIE